jgi:hypothetical protein
MAGTTLTKSVSLRIVANAGTAKATLDDISQKANSINGKTSSIKINVTGAGIAKADMDEITAKADALGIKNIRFNFKSDTSTARTDIDKTDRSIRQVGRSTAMAIMGITGFGDVATLTSKDSSSFAKTLAALDFATGVLEPTLAGVIVTTMTLGSGFLAAGVGAGVFGLAVKGTVTDVENANQAGVKLKGSMGELQREMTHAQTEWSRWIGSSASGVADVLTPALKLLPAVLADASLFLEPIESALQNIIIQVKAALDSPFWKSTILEWAATSGPLLEDIADAIGNIVHGLAGVLTTFMPMSTSMGAALDKITAKFAKWGETLGSHSGFQSLMAMFKTEAPLAMKALENLAGTLLGVGKAMSGLTGIGNSKQLLEVIDTLSGWTNKLANSNPELVRTILYTLSFGDALKRVGNMAHGIGEIARPFKDVHSALSGLSAGLRGVEVAEDASNLKWAKFGTTLAHPLETLKKLATSLKILRTATVEDTAAQEGLDVAMEANPIGIVIAVVVALVAVIVILTMKSKAFRDFWKAAWQDIKNWTSDTISFLHADWSAFVNDFVKGGHAIESGWNAVVRNLKQIGQNAINFLVLLFWGLPVKIVSALSSLGSRLYSVGYNAVMGLWRGISSMIGFVVGQVENFASKISGAFSKVLGMFSPSRVFMQHGRNIALGLVQGMTGMLSTVEGASTGLGAAVGRGFNVQAPRATGTRGAAGAPSITVNINGVVGDAGAAGRQIVQAINTYLRQTGQGELANA